MDKNKKAIEAFSEGRVASPILINEVTTSLPEEYDVYFKYRAVQQNVAKIIEFLKSGGSEADILPTPFKPNLQEIKERIAAQLK